MQQPSILIAEGKAAVPGADAHLKYNFDPDKKPGAVLPDGSIDLRERNTVIGVTADTLLGEFVPASKGEPGVNLRGEEIPTSDGEEGTFTAGDHVRTDKDGDSLKFFAEIDGAVSVEGDTIGVNPIASISGDVDYEAGNIDASGDVEISGSVRSGFSVKSGGNVTIGDMIEDGASVRARGDVIVAKGILGEAAKVIAVGNVESKFIQNSTVMAGSNIIVGAYIYNGIVRAGGQITVKSGGGERGGSIVGGEVVATKGIEAKLVGSASTDRTVVGIGAEPEQAARLKKVRKTIQFCDTEILRLLRTLGLQDVEADALKRIIERSPPSKKEAVVNMVIKLKELVSTKSDSVNERAELQKSINDSMADAQLIVNAKVFADVHIRFGDAVHTVPEDLDKPIFYVGEDGLRYRPQ